MMGEKKLKKFSKAQRMLAIVNLLTVTEQIGSAELIRLLNTTERTFYRDLSDLKEMGVPVYFKNGFRLDKTFWENWKLMEQNNN